MSLAVLTQRGDFHRISVRNASPGTEHLLQLG